MGIGSRGRVWLKAAGAAVLGVYVLYVLIANALLLLGGLAWLAPHFTRDVHFATGKSYSLVPGVIELRDFKMTVRDSNVHLVVSIPRGETTVLLWRLASKKFVASRVRGQHVTVWLRPSSSAFPRAAGTLQPPITPPRKPSGEPAKPEMLWGVRLGDVDIQTDDVWIEQLRVRGSTRIQGAFDFQPLRHLAIDHTRARSGHARLTLGKRTLAPDLRLAARVDLARQDLRSGASLLPKLDLALYARGTLSPAPLLKLAGPGLPLSMGGAPGFVDADLEIEHATVKDGSWLELTVNALGASRGPWHGDGRLTLALACHDKTIEASASIDGATLEEKGVRVAHLANAHGVATTSSDLGHPSLDAFDVVVAGASLDDAGIVAGQASGKLLASFAARYDGARLKGAADVHLDAGRWRGDDFSAGADGDLHFVATARSPFDAVELDGVELALRDASVRRGGRVESGFGVRLTSNKLVVSTRRLRVSGRVKMEWPDGKALQIVTSVEPPPIVGGLFSASDLHATADVDLEAHEQDIEIVDARTSDFKLRGRVLRCGASTNATLLIDRGALSFGIWLQPDDTDIVPLAGNDWLEGALSRFSRLAHSPKALGCYRG